ncbi:MAG: hypothetical protein Q9172_007816 [Xanthocarpia lactea]
MTTDTAVRVTRMVIQGQNALGQIAYIDYPEIRVDEHESTEMPFRYVKDADGEPVMPERYSMHFVRHLVALEVGRSEDLVAAAAKVLQLEDARSSMVLEFKGASGNEGGEEEKKTAASEENERMHLKAINTLCELLETYG